MNEVEKMYVRCKIKKQRTCSHSDTCYNGSLDECEGCNAYQYPPFTAEKQVELIKLLAKGEIKIDNTDGEYEFSVFDTVSDFSSFEESLADLTNRMWQDLAKEEKQQIKDILSE